MNTIVKLRTIIACLLLATSTIALSQDEEGGFTLSGSVDTYFRANLNGSNDPDDSVTLAPATSFADQPGFSIGMINLIASYEGEKVGFVGDLVFGPRGGNAVFGSGGIDVNGNVVANASTFVNQLYTYVKVTDRITFTLGNFNTFLGYEVISPTANFNYSTSYMFSYGPFSHTGLKMDVDLGGGFSAMAAVLNPTDATEFNISGRYFGGGQLGYENEAGGAWLNVLFDDSFFQIDLTTGWDVSETVYVGFNGTTNDFFSGAALYLQNSFSDSFSLGVRGEWFQTHDEFIDSVPEDESVLDLTFSANYSIGNLTLIPEFRTDLYSQDDVVITDAQGEAANSLTSFVLAAVYAF